MSLIPWRRGQESGLTRAEERDPFTALQHEMNRMFDSFWSGNEMFRSPMWAERADWMAPKLDVAETEKTVEVTRRAAGPVREGSRRGADERLSEDSRREERTSARPRSATTIGRSARSGRSSE